jgi:hypothetical protein
LIPEETIDKNGFRPELLENEYQKLRFTEHDVDALLRKFFLSFNHDLVTTNNNTAKPLVENIT